VFATLHTTSPPQSQKPASPFIGSARPPPQNTSENLTVSKRNQATLGQRNHQAQKPLKSKAKESRAFRDVKFFNKNLHLRTSGSIFIKKFAPLTVSGLVECFVFRGFFAKKNNCCFFVSDEFK